MSGEQWFRETISRQRRGWPAMVARAALRAAEPFYASIVGMRNGLFDRGTLRNRSPGRPVVSVGNITTGGTGKTPVVTWLARRFIEADRNPAILMRGYKARPGAAGDEQQLLQQSLPATHIIAHPDRLKFARLWLLVDPLIDLFILDDGFQHRQLRREFDLVLIDASEPFGFDHVLPRGLLREPLVGLSRASGILITHCEGADEEKLGQIEQALRRYSAAPQFRCEHRITHFIDGNNRRQSIEPLRGQAVFSFCGIGNPQAFESQLRELGLNLVGSRRFADHYEYSDADLKSLRDDANHAKAALLFTTEKDWVKIATLNQAEGSPPIARAELSVEFRAGDEDALFQLIRRRIGR